MKDAAAAGDDETRALAAAVQYNCDVSDARHAREGPLCTYLLGMRELYRWSSGAPPQAPVDRQAVGAFISAREAAWDALFDAQAPYRPLPLGAGLEAFDEARSETLMRAHGLAALVYGGGVGRFGAPVFFLARREREAQLDGVAVIYAGVELARGIVAPPAISRGGRIVVRTDAMRRWLWTRAEAGAKHARAGGLAALIADHGGTLADAIERIVADHAESLALHEVGELRAATLLGADWERMLLSLSDRRAESVARAVRDLLADTLVTLPALVERGAPGALRFWFANLEGLRRTLAPSLAALAGGLGPDAARLRDAVMEEHARHRSGALALLAAWRGGGAAAVREAADALLAAAQAE